MKKCLHKTIEITEITGYVLPKGYDAFQKEKEQDWAKYNTGGLSYTVYCSDCDTVLED